jgi:hypothetical protein
VSCAMPPSSDAAENSASPTVKTRRRPRMSPIRPPASSRPPKISPHDPQQTGGGEPERGLYPGQGHGDDGGVHQHDQLADGDERAGPAPSQPGQGPHPLRRVSATTRSAAASSLHNVSHRVPAFSALASHRHGAYRAHRPAGPVSAGRGWLRSRLSSSTCASSLRPANHQNHVTAVHMDGRYRQAHLNPATKRHSSHDQDPVRDPLADHLLTPESLAGRAGWWPGTWPPRWATGRARVARVSALARAVRRRPGQPPVTRRLNLHGGPASDTRFGGSAGRAECAWRLQPA